MRTHAALVMDDVESARVAPVFPALSRYGRLGFVTDVEEPAYYDLAHHGVVHLHLFPVDPDEPDGSGGIVYRYVSDADTLQARWTSAGFEGRFLGSARHPLRAARVHHTDSDGIVHRVGSTL